MKISPLPPHFHLFTIYKLHLKLPNSAKPSTHSATRPAAQMSFSEFMAEAAGGITGHETHNPPLPRLIVSGLERKAQLWGVIHMLT